MKKVQPALSDIRKFRCFLKHNDYPYVKDFLLSKEFLNNVPKLEVLGLHTLGTSSMPARLKKQCRKKLKQLEVESKVSRSFLEESEDAALLLTDWRGVEWRADSNAGRKGDAQCYLADAKTGKVSTCWSATRSLMEVTNEVYRSERA
eukprot:gb/GEZN01013217.1/.p1 GENE.gb/GEZN01013217.1/~~gb/GEZN01013217.1/.p1  ORF type:complete len:147 (+),score=10.95 gb/GEZN01013217.1/:579-1019(+)